jgi:hypothetical protein
MTTPYKNYVNKVCYNEVRSNDLYLRGDTIKYTKSVSDTYCPHVTMVFTASEAIPKNRLIKMSNQEFKVAQVKVADPYSTIIVGVSSTESLADGDLIEVTVNGVFTAQVSTVSIPITAGMGLEKSMVEDGKVVPQIPLEGSIGVSLQDANPGSLVKGIFKKNEVF